MKKIIMLLAAIVLLGCLTSDAPARLPSPTATLQPTVSPTSSANASAMATPTVSAYPSPQPPKLDGTAIARQIRWNIEGPHGWSWCTIGCEALKPIIQQYTCTLGLDYRTPMEKAFNFTLDDRKSQSKVEAYQAACRAQAPEVIFDCNTLQQGSLSCGPGIPDCHQGGFYIQYNRTRFLDATGYEIDTRIFVDSDIFNDVLKRNDCPKPPS